MYESAEHTACNQKTQQRAVLTHRGAKRETITFPSWRVHQNSPCGPQTSLKSTESIQKPIKLRSQTENLRGKKVHTRWIGLRPHKLRHALSSVLYHGVICSSEVNINQASSSRHSQSAGPQASWRCPSITPADIWGSQPQAEPAKGTGGLGDSDCQTDRMLDLIDHIFLMHF